MSLPITSLLRTLLADGVEPDAIIRAVEAAELGMKRGAGVVADRRGRRIPADWLPSAELLEYANKLSLTPDQTAIEVEKFKNYWSARSGTGAMKRDWDATFRNWLINTMERQHGNSVGHQSAVGRFGSAGPRQTHEASVLAGMGRLARSRAQERNASRSDNKPMERDADALLQLGFDHTTARSD
jgi:hypothetical protein